MKFILKLKDLGISLKEMKFIAAYYELNNQSEDNIIPQLITILDGHIEKIDALANSRKASKTVDFQGGQTIPGNEIGDPG